MWRLREPAGEHVSRHAHQQNVRAQTLIVKCVAGALEPVGVGGAVGVRRRLCFVLRHSHSLAGGDQG